MISTYDPMVGAISFWYYKPGPAYAGKVVESEDVFPGVTFDFIEETDYLVGFEILDSPDILAAGAELPVPTSALDYDTAADVLRLDFVPRAGRPRLRRKEVYPRVDVLLDADDRIVAIDVREASKVLAPGAVTRVAAE